MNDSKGETFYKIHELPNQSIKHHCESCIFTEHCTHECCLKLLSFTYHHRISSFIYDEEPTSKQTSIIHCKRSRTESTEDVSLSKEDDDLFSAIQGQEYQSDNGQYSLEDDRPKYENESLKPTNMSQKINTKKLKTDLLLKTKLEDPPEIVRTGYIKLRNCSPKMKFSIIPDGNCLYRFSWLNSDQTCSIYGIISPM